MDPNDYTGRFRTWEELVIDGVLGVTSPAIPDASGGISHWDQRGLVTKGEAAEEVRQKAAPQDESQDAGKMHLLSTIRTLENRVETLERANMVLVHDRQREQADTRNILLRAERAEAVVGMEQCKVRDRERSIVALTLEVQDLRREIDTLRSRPQPSGARKLQLGTSVGDGM